MALIADILAEVKETLNIAPTDTTFDADLTIDVAFAIKEIYPRAKRELEVETVDIDDGLKFTVPSGMEIVKAVQVADQPIDFKTHAGICYLMGSFDSFDDVDVFGWGRYDLATLPVELEPVIIYFACYKFYAKLAGNRRKYNIYVGNAGAVANRDIKDSLQLFKDLGDEILDQQEAVRGM